MTPADVSFRTAFVVRVFAVAAVGFLLVGVGLYGLAAAKLVWPDFLADRAMLTYGRVLPAGTDALLFGWLTLGLLAVALHAVPRLSGRPLFSPLAAFGAFALIAGGTAAGTGAVLTGYNAGGHWLEYPLVVDGALIAGFFIIAAVLTITASRGAGRSLPLAGWYLVASPWWLVLSYAAGAAPVFDGLAGEVQSAFSGSATLGLWVVAAAVGGAYHVVSEVVPGARFHPRLGPIGFWSLAFAWAWSTGRTLQYGPTGDWYETLPILFGAGVVLASITIVTDFVQALRGHWHTLSDSTPLRLIAAGLAILLVAPAVAFLGSLRSVSVVTGLTQWEAGYEQLVLFGIGTMLTIGLLGWVLPREAKRTMGRWSGHVVLWFGLTGVVAAAGSRLVAGLQQGFAWLAGVQTGAYENSGEGFGESLRPLHGVNLVQVGGIALILVAALVFAIVVLRHTVGRPVTVSASPTAMPVAPVATVLRGAIALFVVAAVGAFVLPAFDSDAEPSLLAEASHGSASSTIWDRGQQLYRSEGCWYCHSRQVRPIVTDVGLGPVSTPGDYAYDDTGLVGFSRLGPDLAHFGARDDAGGSALAARLTDPTADRDWSVMPSFGYLSDGDLAALAAYVAGLE